MLPKTPAARLTPPGKRGSRDTPAQGGVQITRFGQAPHLMCGPARCCRPLPQAGHRDLAPDDEHHGHRHVDMPQRRGRQRGQQDERGGHHDLVGHRVEERAESAGDVELHTRVQFLVNFLL